MTCLPRKKSRCADSKEEGIRGGHKVLANQTISQVYEAIENLTKLKQCKMALKEKLEVMKQCDQEILEQISKGEVENKIEQADMFKEKVQRAIIDVTNTIIKNEMLAVVIAGQPPPTLHPPISTPSSPARMPIPCHLHLLICQPQLL